MFPQHGANLVEYGHDQFEQTSIADFTGGLNITDPATNLPPNQFTRMLNFYFNRQGVLYSRPPLRPYAFSTNTVDEPVTIDFDYAGDMYTPIVIHDYLVFQTSSAAVAANGWTYNNEMHVVLGTFSDAIGSDPDQYCVVVFNSSDAKWTKVWSKAAATVTAVSVCPFEINQAFDLLIFPDAENPERWTPSDATSGGDIIGVASDLGLTAPEHETEEITGGTKGTQAIFTLASTTGAEVGGHVLVTDSTVTEYNGVWEIIAVTADTSIQVDGTEAGWADPTDGTIHFYGVAEAGTASDADRSLLAGDYTYAFSYFYDDSGTSTKYGESSLGLTHTITVAADQHVTIYGWPIPAGVTSVRIYRSPPDQSSGPFKFVGDCSDCSTEFVDNIPVGEEGDEALPDGTNPSAGTDLDTINFATVGAHLVGFDENIRNKLIWSTAGYPDVFHPLDYDYLEGDGRKVIEFNRKIYAFTTRGVWQKETMSSPAIKICNIGCIDGGTVQDVGNGLIWSDYDTVYFADFVQQYGSKGDFPLDIGRTISSSVRRRLTTGTMSSVFFERRYYITYTDTEDHLRRTYVYDVDIGGWTQHSSKHIAWARGSKTMYSLGGNKITRNLTATDKTTDGTGGKVNFKITAHGLSTGDIVTISGTTNYNGAFAITYVDVDNFTIVDTYVGIETSGQITITKYYAYQHDYSDTVAIVSGFSTYAGKDYHDYSRVAQTTWHGIADIVSEIARPNAKLAGDFRKIFFSSLSIEAQGSVIGILATISAQNNAFSTSKQLNFGVDVETETITGGVKHTVWTFLFVASTTGMELGKSITISGSTAGEYDGTYTIMTVAKDSYILIALASSGFSNDPNGLITATKDTEPSTTYEMVWGLDGDGVDNNIWMSGSGSDIGDATEGGWAAVGGIAGVSSSASLHTKINRIMKSNAIGLTLISLDSRNMQLLSLTLYWKPLQPIA